MKAIFTYNGLNNTKSTPHAMDKLWPFFKTKLPRNSARRGVSRWGTHLDFGHPLYSLKIRVVASILRAVTSIARVSMQYTVRIPVQYCTSAPTTPRTPRKRAGGLYS